jgi:hypothetical protein
MITIIDGKEIESRGGSTLSTRISGSGSTISTKAPSRTIVFVNESWLSAIAPGYVFKNDIIYKVDPGMSEEIYQYEGVSSRRLFNSALPGGGVKDHEFECRLYNSLTHHDLGQMIADEINYDFYCNTPNLDVQKTFIISSGETWWSAIARLFAIWNPIILVKSNTVYVLDQSGDNQDVLGSGSNLSMTEDSFTLYNYEIRKNSAYVDHIAITGPSTTYTYTGQTKTITRRSHSKTTLPGQTETEQIETTIEYEDGVDTYTKLYNINIEDEREGRVLRTIQKKVDYLRPQVRATIEDKEERWNASGTKISQVTTTYEWADFDTPVSSHTEQYERVPKIGGGYTETKSDGIIQQLPEYEWRKTKEVDVTYGDMLEEAGAVEMDIVEYGEITTNKFKETVDNEDYWAYDLAQPYWQARQTGYKVYEELEEGEGWIRAWATIKSETVRYDESSPSLLKKLRTVRTFFPLPTIRTNTEDIPLPKENVRNQRERRWEYFRVGDSPQLYEYGDTVPSGDFRPRLDLFVADCITQSDAYKIAQRFFALSQEYEAIATIELTIPLFSTMLGSTINLPACTKQYFDWNTKEWTNVTLAAKSYRVVGHSKIRRYGGEPTDDQRELIVTDRLELKEKF